jgi:hypothetical protein
MGFESIPRADRVRRQSGNRRRRRRSSGDRCVVVSRGLEQLFEQRPIVHKRLPLLLGADITALLGQMNAVCGAVVLDDLRMVCEMSAAR